MVNSVKNIRLFTNGDLMVKMIFYHGTSEENAKRIEKEGFVPDRKYNWKVKGKKGFVYLSLAYAPFYALNAGFPRLAIIKVEVDTEDLYPEDDFIMLAMKRPSYTQNEINMIDLEEYKNLWVESIQYLGNVAVKPEKIRVLGIRFFDGKKLIMKCDPVISPLNYKILGEYYRKLTEWIFDGKDFMEFPSFMAV